MNVPNQPWALMYRIYRNVLPDVALYLENWREKAETIPNDELRKQALMSIDTKEFHCQGGAILALLAGEQRQKVIEFVVAYQTISDYLDNLCDRSTSLDPKDFEALHESMIHALTPGAERKNYYRLREDQNDGDYLWSLVQTCQRILSEIPHYSSIADSLLDLAHYYCDLQIHKHVMIEERVPRLQAWYRSHKDSLPAMSWYEFSACTGSTLGIFCLVSYASQKSLTAEQVQVIKNGYFPWVQGLHILLDYFVDQQEDEEGGDLNFCSYYENGNQLLERFGHFVEQADHSIQRLPDSKFHKLINRGLLGIYLADQKVDRHPGIKKAAGKIMKMGGGITYFFYMNRRLMQRLKPSV
ncbi:tetraprenyl-beta-curcumene synthase [Fictibacillus solisalsi]|uniref:Tetraprenyl-beta-curcumene synthase n=1 Tax=Fictibacillus solisalsi TaxID=459525 RepID=A0A1G9X420_9BACL|nr:tetraprenyl-beta-curcumene synthase family protein [Fictibacillus solisalsi]SDM91291.1 tetraprenyl-beta-curcumene synthase [Fictibacillus solisalsi]